MKPSLNPADIKLLKSIFTTKNDLVSVEKRLNKNTKKYLQAMEARMDKKYATKNEINQRFEQLEAILTTTFKEIEDKFGNKIARLEEFVGISKSFSP